MGGLEFDMRSRGQSITDVEKAREEFGNLASQRLQPRGKAKHLMPESLLDNARS